MSRRVRHQPRILAAAPHRGAAKVVARRTRRQSPAMDERPIGTGSGGRRAAATRFLRYASVGALATAVHYGVLVGLVEGGLLAPRYAAAVGAWIGAQVAFAGNARFTFDGAVFDLRSWIRFQLTALVGAAISFSIVALGVRAGLHYLLAQALATLLTLFITYEINRRWSFATPARR
jgi:putative flippase GtrA